MCVWTLGALERQTEKFGRTLGISANLELALPRAPSLFSLGRRRVGRNQTVGCWGLRKVALRRDCSILVFRPF